MDPYYKKTIIYPHEGYKFEFDIATNLFSSFDVDHGTDLFIRSIVLNNPKTILDLGCGYGPIGIVLAKKTPDAQVTMLDSNLLAIRYTKLNIQKNNIHNATALGSVGIEQVRDKSFDLIVSNIPARIGEEAIINEFILEPIKHLNSGGEFWFVVVSKLNQLIIRVGKQNKLRFKKISKRRGHTVYIFTKK
ncbi:methyltransferase [Candidatus Gottesmanbacteria bacterium RIFCSPHIGHO2_01_FULL_39_10]|uniref:Methyltransferase n=1 Tax=Candidatus Gottesmanbacteria bacterium RIFCSPHIGHO2_01_FULL_39_10 TaxID=1798375 RepID=A0A1F5ZM93_9BACT|nr:MAG: methyltransferase [Candidatus Gottesmanbacteria bacterium RIFCSPHIGHO2_01_FULL_39_10]